MCIRQIYYMACTDCNNQFIDPKWGGYFSSPEEVKKIARERGWLIDEVVENGSEWDICPRCQKKETQSE